MFDRYRYSMASRDYRVHVWRFPRRSRHLGHRHASVTSDEVKCTPYVLCTYHIDEHVRITQNAQRASNALNVLDYELRRKYVHSYVSNCCSVLVFGVRNNSVGGSQGFASIVRGESRKPIVARNNICAPPIRHPDISVRFG